MWFTINPGLACIRYAVHPKLSASASQRGECLPDQLRVNPNFRVNPEFTQGPGASCGLLVLIMRSFGDLWSSHHNNDVLLRLFYNDFTWGSDIPLRRVRNQTIGNRANHYAEGSGATVSIASVEADPGHWRSHATAIPHMRVLDLLTTHATAPYRRSADVHHKVGW